MLVTSHEASMSDSRSGLTSYVRTTVCAQANTYLLRFTILPYDGSAWGWKLTVHSTVANNYKEAKYELVTTWGPLFVQNEVSRESQIQQKGL